MIRSMDAAFADILTMCGTNGLITRSTAPCARAVRNVTFMNDEASPRAISARPSPISFPSMIEQAAARANPTVEMRSLATVTMEFAATISEPRCPMMIEFMLNANPHMASLTNAGME